jgi:hypothetical protein
MILLTKHGINTYVLLLQHLYNWNIDWDFMRIYLPYASIRADVSPTTNRSRHHIYDMHIEDALRYVISHTAVQRHFDLCRVTWTLSVYPVPHDTWTVSASGEDEGVLAKCMVGGRFCAVRHMMILWHGRVPGFCDWIERDYFINWLIQVRVRNARHLALAAHKALHARLDDDLVQHDDLVQYILDRCFEHCIDDIFACTYGY